MGNNIFHSKKGGEEIMSAWWLIVTAFVCVGIVAGVLIYYSSDFNVKDTEAEVLARKIFDCLTDSQGLKQEVLMQGNSLDIFNFCNIAEEVVDKKESFFFFQISIINEGKEVLRIEEGNNAIKGDCGATISRKNSGVIAKNYPACFELQKLIPYFDSIDNKMKIGGINIITASNQEGGKIPIN